jgi:hypothetical protein
MEYNSNEKNVDTILSALEHILPQSWYDYCRSGEGISKPEINHTPR